MNKAATILRVSGEVERPQALTWNDLASFDREGQVPDMTTIDPNRRGGAITLAALARVVQPAPQCRYLTLHASRDDFHVSLPLEVVRDRGYLIYRRGGEPLRTGDGGPVRFFIRDHTACHDGEIDECANVKFVDRIEFSQERGLDTRPDDEAAHQALHQQTDRSTIRF